MRIAVLVLINVRQAGNAKGPATGPGCASVPRGGRYVVASVFLPTVLVAGVSVITARQMPRGSQRVVAATTTTLPVSSGTVRVAGRMGSTATEMAQDSKQNAA